MKWIEFVVNSAGGADPIDGVRVKWYVLAGSGGCCHLQSRAAADSSKSQQSQLHQANGNGKLAWSETHPSIPAGFKKK